MKSPMISNGKRHSLQFQDKSLSVILCNLEHLTFKDYHCCVRLPVL